MTNRYAPMKANRMNIHRENGYDDRDDYLASLAEDYGVDPAIVEILADFLGEDEDFDGLVTMVQDAAE